MTPDARHKLRNLLVNHEGYKQFPYADTTGHLTVGIGRNLSDRGISQTEAFTLLDDDILYFYAKLNSQFSYFSHLNEDRQIALIDMCFNLGINHFLSFDKMNAALEINDFNTAADEIMHSKWEEQVGERAHQIAAIIRTGSL